ncbi:MAG TPA: NUDIX domain-containing protein [Candidatus Saccharimonadia bacterium]|nr:NUDIX domain-containing protein [Candidatus Saccharimonadia bacterium]
MPHIHTQPGHHDLTTSAFIIRTDGPEPTVVLHVHRKRPKLFQFGGHVELDENPWQALVRELQEESGYDIAQLTVLQPPGSFRERFSGTANHPLPFYFNTHHAENPDHLHYHSDLSHAMLAAGEPAHPIDPRESQAIHRFTAADVRALPTTDIFDQTRTNALYILEHLMHHWEAVPASRWPV